MSFERQTHDSLGKLMFVLPVAALLLVGGGLVFWFPLAGRSGGEAHTVIVILVDTLRADALGCYGNEENVTPHLDTLAKDAARFDAAFTTSGWTMPSVASLFTGAWTRDHGAGGQRGAFSGLPSHLPVAAELFSAAGFNTFAVANAMFIHPRFGFGRGFDIFDHDPAVVGRMRRADVCVDKVIGWLGDNRSESNFIFLHLFDPHLPYEPPEEVMGMFADAGSGKPQILHMKQCLEWPGQVETVEFPTKRGQKDNPPPAEHTAFVRGRYLEEVHYTDRQIGRLLDALRDMGMYEATTIVVLSDHGEEFWEHGGFEHGHTLFDELIRIPLILKPGKAGKPGADVVKRQVSVLDVMPTLLEEAGIPIPESFAGDSLLKMMQGEDEAVDRPVYASGTLYGSEQYAVRGESYKLILEILPESGEPLFELYHTATDIGEQSDISKRSPDILEKMAKMLFEHFGDVLETSAESKIGNPVELDEEELQTLESLGYIR